MAMNRLRMAVPLVALALTLTACGSDDKEAASGAGELVVASTGGSFTEAQTEAFFEPFEAETGIDVKVATQDSTVGPVKAQVENKNVQWDVVFLAPIDAQVATVEGLVEPIDYDIVKKDGLRPEAAGESSIAALYSASVVAWNSDKAKDIASSDALFDTTKYPGKRAIRSATPYGVLEMALMADGVAKDDLYPLDVDRAFAKLDEIKEDTIFFATNEQGVQLLSSGQATVGIVPNGRAFRASEDGQPIDYTFNGGVTFVDQWVVPKGAKNTENAMKFIDFISQADGQKKLGEIMAYGGNNPAADALYSKEQLSHMPTSPENLSQQVTMDQAWWSENLTTVFDRWQEWLVK